MAGKVTIEPEHMSQIITGAVVLQLPQDVRDRLIGNAIREYLEAPSSTYDKQTRIHRQVFEAIDKAVRVLFDELIVQEPYREQLMQFTRERLTALFENVDGEMKNMVDAVIERAIKAALEKR
jgi:hypothetical protein